MASSDLVTSDSAIISTIAKSDISIHGPLTEAEDLVAELRLTDAVDSSGSGSLAVATSPINAISTSVEGLAAAKEDVTPEQEAASQDEDLTPEQEAAAEQCAQAFVDKYEHVSMQGYR